ncbi:hypothetical protein REPUB_Repub17cG0084300 [Reevesia pubescens]
MAREVYFVQVAESQVASLKKKTAVTTSWISIDAKGQGVILDVDKEKIIVLNLEVLLRDPLDDNVIPMVAELKRRLPQDNHACQCPVEEEEHPGACNDMDTGEENEFPFEFRALEVALEAICSFLDARTSELETDTYPALDELTSMISGRNLDRVRKLKSAMTRLTNRVQKASTSAYAFELGSSSLPEYYV